VSQVQLNTNRWYEGCGSPRVERQWASMEPSDPIKREPERPPDQSPGTRHPNETGHGSGLESASDLLPLVYDELRQLAASRLSRLPPGQTLQPTALVHDAFLRLVGDKDPGWNGHAHFFGAAAMAMRNILVESARRKSAVKHGGERQRVALVDDGLAELAQGLPAEEVLALDHVLGEFERVHPRPARVVMFRYFVGFTNEQVAEVMDIGLSTVKRDWRFACAWLRSAMCEDGATDD
jgi:RNA polymerase sigma factor (TIGR02999 family)